MGSAVWHSPHFLFRVIGSQKTQAAEVSSGHRIPPQPHKVEFSVLTHELLIYLGFVRRNGAGGFWLS